MHWPAWYAVRLDQVHLAKDRFYTFRTADHGGQRCARFFPATRTTRTEPWFCVFTSEQQFTRTKMNGGFGSGELSSGNRILNYPEPHYPEPWSPVHPNRAQPPNQSRTGHPEPVPNPRFPEPETRLTPNPGSPRCTPNPGTPRTPPEPELT